MLEIVNELSSEILKKEEKSVVIGKPQSFSEHFVKVEFQQQKRRRRNSSNTQRQQLDQVVRDFDQINLANTSEYEQNPSLLKGKIC